MSKITISLLRDQISLSNIYQAESGSNIFFKFNPRNGHQAVDEIHISHNGKTIHNNGELGTSKECSDWLYMRRSSSHGKIAFNTMANTTMAKEVLLRYMSFDGKYENNVVILTQIRMLEAWAKVTRAYGTAREFYTHLQDLEN